MGLDLFPDKGFSIRCQAKAVVFYPIFFTLKVMTAYCVHTSTHQPRFAPPAPQLWGEIGTFRGFKSPRIGGFRGREKVKTKIKNLCVHSRVSLEGQIAVSVRQARGESYV